MYYFLSLLYYLSATSPIVGGVDTFLLLFTIAPFVGGVDGLQMILTDSTY